MHLKKIMKKKRKVCRPGFRRDIKISSHERMASSGACAHRDVAE